MQGKNRK